MSAYEELRAKTADGLSLEVRKYPGGAATPALCLPGLTRNVRDFNDFALWLSGRGRTVYAMSFRGRGGSDRDPNYLNYHPLTYRDDVLAVLDQLGLDRAVLVGTSLGGIVTMLTSLAAPERVAAAILNDIGPELAPEGLARIAGYVGKSSGAASSLDDAAAQIRAVNEVAFPGRDDEFWRAFARNTFVQQADGGWALDYDPGIARALAEAGAAPDLAAAFASLDGVPTLLVRGALSDLLTEEIADRMQTAAPDMAQCVVAGVGHAPTLSEPEALAAIGAFLGARP